MRSSVITRPLFTALAAMAAASPLLAQAEELERVEVRGRVVEATPRHNVRAACVGIDEQLQSALARLWNDEHLYGEVKVQMVLMNDGVDGVQARGVSSTIARSVRKAVRRLDCAPSDSGPQVYRFSVDFIDPDQPAGDGSTRTASRLGVRISG